MAAKIGGSSDVRCRQKHTSKGQSVELQVLTLPSFVYRRYRGDMIELYSKLFFQKSFMDAIWMAPIFYNYSLAFQFHVQSR